MDIQKTNPRPHAHCRQCGREFIPETRLGRLCGYCSIDRQIEKKYKKVKQ